MRQLLINADDFGWTDGHNLAVERAHLGGLLNRASLLCNGDDFAPAVELAGRCPRLGVGIHLTLSEGRPLTDPARLPRLTRPDGTFHDRLVPLLWLWQTGRLSTDEAHGEWRAQIERARRAGVRITHLDSHKHVHLFPPLLSAIIALAQEYRVPYVRLPVEPAAAVSAISPGRAPAWLALKALGEHARRRLRAAGLRFADRFYGFGESGAMTPARLGALLGRLHERPGPAGPAGETVEIMVHPAVVTPAVAALGRRFGWARRYRFEDELAALCDPSLPPLVADLSG